MTYLKKGVDSVYIIYGKMHIQVLYLYIKVWICNLINSHGCKIKTKDHKQSRANKGIEFLPQTLIF